jgi:RNA polymerase sigma-70 factor (ECF subfamily)
MSLPLPIWLAQPPSSDDAIVRSASRASQPILEDSESGRVARVRTGDADAFGAIVRDTAPRLVSFAYGLTRSRDMAEDIVQDVFAAIWHRRETWDPDSVVAYLLTAVRNRAFKAARAREVAERHASRAELPSASPLPDELLEEAADTRLWIIRFRALRDELDRLTERQRTAYLLRYEQGLTIPQIARVLDVSAKGAEQLVRRTTQVLRDRLRTVQSP